MQNSPSTLASHLIRLEKHIAQLGLASRREAKDLILKGLVTVNGKVIKNTGHGIDPTKDKVIVKQDSKNPKEYILLYKPRGVETNKTTENLKDIHDLYPQYRHLSPIGRLDADSEGLIILSNDGTLAKALTKEESSIGKTYKVSIRERIVEASLREMAKGVMLDDKKTKPTTVTKFNDQTFIIVLHEGRKHQIRRMCERMHWNVTSLLRIKIGHLDIGHMRPGEGRKLSKGDIDKLKGL